MKSIKPGRGPSWMGAIAGIAAVAFGVLWTIGASSMTSSVGDMFYADPFEQTMSAIFPLFGVVFVIVAIAGVIYNFKNATGKRRYSEYDIVDADEESDPLNERFGEETPEQEPEQPGSFCPYCGKKIEDDYRFCNRCGKRLPE